MPGRCVEVLRGQRDRQVRHRSRAAAEWQEHGLAFASETGTALDAANVRRGSHTVLEAAGLDAGEWTPRELRHSFVPLLSDSGMTIDQSARLVVPNPDADTRPVSSGADERGLSCSFVSDRLDCCRQPLRRLLRIRSGSGHCAHLTVEHS
ncbi:MAG: hypothetical protein L0I76_11435 [Pseudonocardia sp.]|nr:hypothetical protein [Pseudonocardia sp.]